MGALPHSPRLAVTPPLGANGDRPAPDGDDVGYHLAPAASQRITRRALVTTDTDARLIELARAGDQRAFEQIVDRYRPMLLGYCRRIVGDAAAQDAVQQACMSAWSALRRGHEVQHVRAWLFTIAHRAALETLRSRGAPTDELPAALAGGPSPHELIEQSARARATLAAVAELPQRQRDALVWTSLHGRSGRDTAQALGVSEGALRQLIVRARARARASVGALVPPVLLWRLPHISGPRRLAGLAERLLGNAGTLSGGEALVWLTPALAAAALVGTPLAPPRSAHHHSPTLLARLSAAPLLPAPAAHARSSRGVDPAAARRALAIRPQHASATTPPAIAPRLSHGASTPSAPAPVPGEQRPTERVGQSRDPTAVTLGAPAPAPVVRVPALPVGTGGAPQAPQQTTVETVVSDATGQVASVAGSASAAGQSLTAGELEAAAKHAMRPLTGLAATQG